MNCPSCGAAMRQGDTWCGQCFDVLSDVTSDGGHLRRPQATEDLPHAPPTFSRWRKTETSFGPVGRLSWTFAVVLVGALTIVSANPFAMISWWLIAVPLILRSVWARKRVT